MDFISSVFTIRNDRDFNRIALAIFHFQYNQNSIYSAYCNALGVNPAEIKNVLQIPFLPIRFFKTHSVLCGERVPEEIFQSSGTTGEVRSRHEVSDLNVYRESLVRGFEQFYGPLSTYDFCALMPSREENPVSSLIFMVTEWIRHADPGVSGFYLHDFPALHKVLKSPDRKKKKTILIGLSYALLDFAETLEEGETDVIVMETGGMKGKRKEMVRQELHQALSEKFGIPRVHSEYGMTELLSQAYSSGEGRFRSPSWMRVLTRDPNDPLKLFPHEKTGCINIIDLANFNSCSFIATEDLGKTYPDGSFEVLGRYDASAARGCNLMIG